MTATSLDLSQIKTDALSAASTFRTLIGLGTLATQSPTGTPSASNFLRGDFSWQTIDLTGYVPYTGATANLDLGSYTLSAKNATIAGGTVTTSTPILNLTQTWNNAAVTFSALKLDVTDTASASGSLLMDLQVGGSSKFKVGKDGNASATVFSSSGNLYVTGGGSYKSVGFSATDTTAPVWINTTGVVVSSGLYFGISASTAGNGPDVYLSRDAANTFAQRNGASAQTFRLYNTYSSSTSFENLQLQWASNEARIGTSVGAVSGTQRDLVLGSWAANGTWTAGLTMTPAGAVTTAQLTLNNSNSQNIGLDVRPWIQIKNNSATLAGYLSNGGSVFTSGASGGTDLGLRAIGAFGISVNNSQTPTFTIASTGVTTFSGNVTVSAVNVVTDTTTGTKIGTGTTQKLGFWNATPIVQPANTTAIDDVLVNTGLRATGGVNNFNNTLDLTIRTVTYGATMAIDAALGNKIAITLTGNGTISNPTNSVDGRVLVFRLRQDGSGNRVPVWDTKYSFVGDLATVTLSTGANKIDRVAFEYDSTDDKWYCISFIKGS